jgi:hypothetical protein
MGVLMSAERENANVVRIDAPPRRNGAAAETRSVPSAGRLIQ